MPTIRRAALSGETAKKGRPSIDGYWIDRIYGLAAKGWGPKRIANQLEKDGAAQGRGGAPSERTVRRYTRSVPAVDLREYAEFQWPQAMLDGLLPWEASRFAIELAEHYRGNGESPPTVKRVLWHWRVSLAFADLSLEDREKWVTACLATEASGEPFPDLIDLQRRVDALPPSLQEAMDIYSRRLATRAETAPTAQQATEQPPEEGDTA